MKAAVASTVVLATAVILIAACDRKPYRASALDQAPATESPEEVQTRLRMQYVGAWTSEKYVIGTQRAKDQGRALATALVQMGEPTVRLDLSSDGTAALTSTLWILGEQKKEIRPASWTAYPDGIKVNDDVLLLRGGKLFYDDDDGTSIVFSRTY